MNFIYGALTSLSLAYPEISISAESVTYFSHVKPIVDAYCTSCHKIAGSAPFALESYDQVKRFDKAMIGAIVSGKMPPSAPNYIATHPIKYNFSISPSQLELIKNWVEAGSPKGDAASEAAPLDKQRPIISKVDMTLTMSSKYQIKAGQSDDYRCFVMGRTHDDFFITGYRVRSTNKQAVHHFALFAYDPEYGETVEKMDASDKEPGFPCFGTPAAPGFDNLPSRLIGGSGVSFPSYTTPPGTGIPLRAGTVLILQMHYSLHNSDHHSIQDDQTSIDLQHEKSVSKSLATPFFFNTDWALGKQMPIPANAKEVVHSIIQDPMENYGFLASIGNLDFKKGIYIYGVTPHQHLLGKGVRFWKEDLKGNRDMLFDNWGRYSFQHQWSFEFERPVYIAPGEKLGLDCLWDNSKENQPFKDGVQQEPKDVNWGESTTDEMCVMTLSVAES